MTAADVAAILARRPVRPSGGNFLVRCVAHDDREPSLSLADGDDGKLLVHCFAGCDPRDVLAAIRATVGDIDAAPRPPQPSQGTGDYQRRQSGKAAWLWSRRQKITGSIAEKYLREVRGLACALPPTLAFLPPTKPQHHPAMVGAFGFCDEPEPGLLLPPRDVVAVHLTLLKPDGSGKAEVAKPKIVVGSPGGLPLVIASANDLLGLAICEGVEDALSAHQATGLGAWAAGSAGFMPKLAASIPDFIEAVTVFAHDDGGRRHALALAGTIKQRGIDVRIEGLP